MNNTAGDLGFLEGNGIIIILLFLAFFGFGGNGFGGNNGAIENQNIINKLDTMSTGLGQATWNLNDGLHMLGSKIDNCCCTTQKEIIESRYSAERNTAAIIDRINALENSHKDELIAQLTNKNNINETVSQLANLQGRYVTNPPCPQYNCGYPCGNLY